MDGTNNTSPQSHLAIYIRQGGIDTATSGPSGREAASYTVDAAITAPERILEEAVYANPWMLGDFTHIDIIADTPRFAACPPQVADSETLAAETARLLWPDADTECLKTERCGSFASTISSFDRSLSGFVSRTFPRAALHHRLTALTGFFASLSKPVNRIKLYAHFAGSDRLDLIALSSDKLIMANSFESAADTDALYFIMAAVKDMGFDQLDDELIVCGDSRRCSEITDTLRRYINSVMPLLLPAPENELAPELLFFYKTTAHENN